MARKGKYHEWLTEDKLLLLSGWARDGSTDKEIAQKMDISLSTFCEWKNRFPEFSEALKINKEIADIEVENALRKRALGYNYEEVTESYKGGVLIEKKKVIKHVAPDTTAQIFWLKNRQPEKWRNNPQPSDEKTLSKLDNILGGIDVIANE